MSLLQDLRFALRIALKNPGFTAVAVMALALGIGANNTVFTLVNTILFKSLPFKDGHEIVSLGCNRPASPAERLAVSYPDFEDWRARAHSFRGIAAFGTGTMNVSDEGGPPERLSGAWLTANAFSLIGQSPVLGRDFLPNEDQRGAQPVVLLGYGVWQARYGSSPEILGKTIRVNAIAATIIGVMPQGMEFPFDAALWMPLLKTREREDRSNRNQLVFARLGEGVSVAQASSELKEIAAQLAREHPKTNAGIGADVMSFNERYNGGRMKMVLWIMMGAVGFVLMIACINVANLLLARAAYRSGEISIRAALGAGRGRIIRQLLIESVLLAALGGFFGLLLSLAGVRWFKTALTMGDIEGMPYWLDFSMDWKVFAYLSVICLAASICFGLVPAMKAARVNLVDKLKEAGERSGEGRKPRRTASSLVVAQLALTMILLAGAGMMIRDFIRSQETSVGVQPENVLTMRLGLPEQKYPTPEDRASFHEKLYQRLQSAPGVRSVALTSHLPVDGAWMGRLQLEGESAEDRDRLPLIPAVSVSPDYFATLGSPTRAGRAFDARDGAAGTEAVIVNERFAARFWSGQDPVGKRIRLLTGSEESPWLRVVGVVPQINREIEKGANFESIAYVPLRQNPVRFVSLAVRTLVPPASLVPTVRREVQALDPDLPLYRIRTMQEHLSQQLWPYRVFGGLFGAFAVASLLLSAIGIYGVTAYSVSRRTREIGLRMAMGADAGSVLRLVLRQATGQLIAGMVFGLAGAAAVGRVLESLLVDTKAGDPAVHLVGSSVLCAIALIACLVPAWRASRMDPLSALRVR